MACNLLGDDTLFNRDVKLQQQNDPSDFLLTVLGCLEEDMNFDRVYKENVSQVINERIYTCRNCENVINSETLVTNVRLNPCKNSSQINPLQDLVDDFLTERSDLDATKLCEICNKNTLHETVNIDKIVPKEYLVIFCI